MKTAFSTLFAIMLIYSPPPAAHASSQIDQFLESHNAARDLVGVSNIQWDSYLAAYAESYALHQKNNHSCQRQPSHGRHGENLFLGSPGYNWTPADAVDSWVSQKQYYNYTTNSCQAGHECESYTQVVWRGSTTLGCVSVTCNDESTFIICSYDPPGNIRGRRPY